MATQAVILVATQAVILVAIQAVILVAILVATLVVILVVILVATLVVMQVQYQQTQLIQSIYMLIMCVLVGLYGTAVAERHQRR